jgi:peptide/nickel transport system permease protein
MADLMSLNPEPALAAAPSRTGRRRATRKRGRVVYAISCGWLILVVLLALTADLLPLEPSDQPISTEFKKPPALRWSEPLGTDEIGRSILSRVIFGLRVSLLVALLSIGIAVVFGVLLGVVAGYLRGWVGWLFDFFTDVLLAFPPLLFLLALSAALQPSFRTLTISLVFLAFPTLARVARANTLTVASREFVTVAKAMGARPRQVIFREIVPNVALPVMSVAFISIAGLMVAEGSLSFLNRGIPRPTPSLGGMIASGRDSLNTRPHLVFVPGIVLLLTVYALNVVGERARARISLRNPDA